jgi:hypothetical protein
MTATGTFISPVFLHTVTEMRHPDPKLLVGAGSHASYLV